MKKLALLLLMFLSLCSCKNDDSNSNEFNIQDKTFVITNYILESSVDLNGDDIYSHDLLEEGNGCVISELYFRLDDTFGAPNYRSLSLIVNDNQTQTYDCIEPDGARLTYQQIDTVVSVTYNDVFYYNGELSNDNNILTFNIPFEHLYGLSLFGDNDIIGPDGTIEEYTGGVMAIYERIE